MFYCFFSYDFCFCIVFIYSCFFFQVKSMAQRQVTSRFGKQLWACFLSKHSTKKEIIKTGNSLNYLCNIGEEGAQWELGHTLQFFNYYISSFQYLFDLCNWSSILICEDLLRKLMLAIELVILKMIHSWKT